MRIFISWSEDSEHVAEALAELLSDVIQLADPFVSTGIRAGNNWQNEIRSALQESGFGIICVTPANQGKPWLQFEAGALALKFGLERVCPYLIGMDPSQLLNGPLSMFQFKKSDRQGTLDLVQAVNDLLDRRIAKERLERLFGNAWAKFDETVRDGKRIVPARTPTSDEMLAEILDTVRSLSRPMPLTASPSIALRARAYPPPLNTSLDPRRQLREQVMASMKRPSE